MIFEEGDGNLNKVENVWRLTIWYVATEKNLFERAWGTESGWTLRTQGGGRQGRQEEEKCECRHAARVSGVVCSLSLCLSDLKAPSLEM